MATTQRGRAVAIIVVVARADGRLDTVPPPRPPARQIQGIHCRAQVNLVFKRGNSYLVLKEADLPALVTFR